MNIEENDFTITPSELKHQLGPKNCVRPLLLDVREPDEFRDWRLDESVNIPIDTLESRIAVGKISRDQQLVTICRTGMRSSHAASLLREDGFNAKSLMGGLVAWSNTYDVATIVREGRNGLKILQVRRLGKGCVSYIVGYQDECVIVDPSAKVDEFLTIAKDEQLRITSVMDTHQHADHVSGARMLARAAHAELLLNPVDQYHYAGFSELLDGRAIEIGDGMHTIRVLHTPGHTLGSVSLQIDGKFMLTGDTLFLDGLARPDLQQSTQGPVQELYRTYRTRFLTLPESVVILPGHVGHLPSSKLGMPLASCIGEVVERIPVLRAQERDFLDFITGHLPPKPPSFEAILRINKGDDPFDPIVIDLLEEGPNNCVLKTGG
jgi:glyoxylase-like metal-dependent hydrolase (beta-lactamase superfamily II)/rhodanese-related sulfurtransferase